MTSISVTESSQSCADTVCCICYSELTFIIPVYSWVCQQGPVYLPPISVFLMNWVWLLSSQYQFTVARRSLMSLFRRDVTVTSPWRHWVTSSLWGARCSGLDLHCLTLWHLLSHCWHMGTAIKHPVPDWVKPSFVIFAKNTNDHITQYGTGCFIAVPIWPQWVSKG